MVTNILSSMLTKVHKWAPQLCNKIFPSDTFCVNIQRASRFSNESLIFSARDLLEENKLKKCFAKELQFKNVFKFHQKMGDLEIKYVRDEVQYEVVILLLLYHTQSVYLNARPLTLLMLSAQPNALDISTVYIKLPDTHIGQEAFQLPSGLQ